MEKPKDQHEAKTYNLGSFKLFGDLRMQNETAFRGIFGWGDAKPEVTWVMPAALSPPKAKPKATAKARAPSKAKAEARATAAAPASSVVDKLAFKDGVAEVGALLEALHKNATKSSYWAQKAKARHLWKNEQLYQRGRTLDTSLRGKKRKRQGGSEGYVAKREVLEQMVKDMQLS